MKATITALNPDEIELRMCVTMPLKEWKALQAQLSSAWPSWKLSSTIGHLVWKAQQNFETDSEVQP